MNPEPVMVTDVSVAPATAEDGVTAAMAGTGFKLGMGVGAGVDPPPPPQPATKQIQGRTEARRKRTAGFIRIFV